jgi:ferredoxin-NADP reductase
VTLSAVADWKVGTAIDRRRLSPILEIFRLKPAPGERFPEYRPGQYIALRRDRCRLTTRAVGQDTRVRYVPDLDESGQPRIGPVTHSYSIASAPWETAENGCLEFYVVLERDEYGTVGRLSGSFFGMSPGDEAVGYVNRITGNFTLDHRASGFGNVLLVGTGTGVAPFVSMIKQLHHEARHGKVTPVRYTLLHANRTCEELAYHQELLGIEAAQCFDFLYVASVSRPTDRDRQDARLGQGRANNVLRHIFDMPLEDARVPPVLPHHVSREELLKRFDPSRTVVLTCGNPASMEDIEYIADTHYIRFEKEDW